MYKLEVVQQFVLQKFPDAVDIQSLAKGGHAHAYSYCLNGKNFVIRFSPHNEDFVKDKFLNKFNSHKLPMPKVHDAGEAFGGYYAVSDRATGIMLDDLSTDQIRLTIPSLLEILDALRTLDISTTVGYGSIDAQGNGVNSSWQEHLLWSLTDNENRRSYGWTNKIENSEYDLSIFNRGLAIFKELIKKLPSDRSLIHYDLLNQNVFCNENEITAIFDWGCATYGDPVFELASFTFWAPLLNGYRDFDWKDIFKSHFAEIGVDVPNFDERLLAYELFIGLDHIIYNAHIEDWENFEQTQGMVINIIETLRARLPYI